MDANEKRFESDDGRMRVNPLLLDRVVSKLASNKIKLIPRPEPFEPDAQEPTTAEHEELSEKAPGTGPLEQSIFGD
jgi:hypothetical protein